MVRTGRRLSSISLGFGGVKHDRVWKPCEVAHAWIRGRQRRTTRDSHSGGLLHLHGDILRVEGRGRADPGHRGQEVMIVIAHDGNDGPLTDGWFRVTVRKAGGQAPNLAMVREMPNRKAVILGGSMMGGTTSQGLGRRDGPRQASLLGANSKAGKRRKKVARARDWQPVTVEE